jgi:hypothetical protein
MGRVSEIFKGMIFTHAQASGHELHRYFVSFGGETVGYVANMPGSTKAGSWMAKSFGPPSTAKLVVGFETRAAAAEALRRAMGFKDS